MGESAYGSAPAFAFRRDIQVLRSAGLDVGFDRRTGKYSAALGPGLLSLSHDELTALALVRGTFAGNVPFGSTVRDLVDRLYVPSGATAGVTPLPAPIHIRIEPVDSAPIRSEVLSALDRARRYRLPITFNYRTNERDASREHKVRIESIALEDGHLYLHALNPENLRSIDFRVDRIDPSSIQVGSQVLPSPPEGRKRIRVVFRLDAGLAAKGVSTHFPGQTVETQSNGDALVSADVPNVFSAMRRLLTYGELCEVIEPPELRAEMHRIGALMTARHGGSD
jgi:predicted DNA-binding transcriptional regulator YafY